MTPIETGPSTSGRRAHATRRSHLRLVAACLVSGCLAAGLDWQQARAAEPELASPWLTEQGVRLRLVAGAVEAPGAARRVYAGIELQLEEGWKTYWRNPGSSGVPPRIELAGSQNVAAAELLFPAPRRFADRDGDTIGYKGNVVLPLRLTPTEPGKPMVLNLAVEIGICREVCIPVQPSLSLAVPADADSRPGGDGLAAALARVPVAEGKAPGAPRAQRIETTLEGAKPQIAIEVHFPGDATAGDVFLEAPDGLWLPMPKADGSGQGGLRRFVVDLADGVDLADLKGRQIRMTLVGAEGQAETSFQLVEAR